MDCAGLQKPKVKLRGYFEEYFADDPVALAWWETQGACDLEEPAAFAMGTGSAVAKEVAQTISQDDFGEVQLALLRIRAAAAECFVTLGTAEPCFGAILLDPDTVAVGLVLPGDKELKAEHRRAKQLCLCDL